MVNVPGRKPIIVTDEIYNQLNRMKLFDEIPFYEIIEELIADHEHLCNIDKKHSCRYIKKPEFILPAPHEAVNNDTVKEIQINKTTLIEFYTDACSPCKAIAPIIDELEATFKDKVVFQRTNLNDNIELATKYEIQATPTIIIEQNGTIVKRFDGVESRFKEKLTKILTKLSI